MYHGAPQYILSTKIVSLNDVEMANFNSTSMLISIFILLPDR